MHDVPRGIVDGMHVLVFEGADHQMRPVRLKKQDMVNDVGSLERIRDPLSALLAILALSAIGEMNIFRKPEALG